MAISKEAIQAAYDQKARQYDFSVLLYGLLGLRIEAYRKRVVELLNLKEGDNVVELGCGTGLNFPLIMKRIGPNGRLIGVDISSDMLACARERAQRAEWNNVELIQTDLALYKFPEKFNGIVSTGVLGYIPEFHQVIDNASHALLPGGRLAVLDLKRPSRWPSWLFKFYMWLGSPFGVTLDYFRFKPWESIEHHFSRTTFEEKYGGLIYIMSGIKNETSLR